MSDDSKWLKEVCQIYWDAEANKWFWRIDASVPQPLSCVGPDASHTEILNDPALPKANSYRVDTSHRGWKER